MEYSRSAFTAAVRGESFSIPRGHYPQHADVRPVGRVVSFSERARRYRCAHNVYIPRSSTAIMSVKRSLFTTPSRSSKRRRPSAARRKAPTMKIPKSLLPETKQFIQTNSLTSSTNGAFQSIPGAMTQGDLGDDYTGSKFRVKRLRVYYDFTQLTLTDSVRISVVIPKVAGSIGLLAANVDPWDTDTYTVVHDMLLPDAQECLAGTFDVTGPINVELNKTGFPTRNDIYLTAVSAGSGAALASIAVMRYCIWFTDA